MVVCLTLIQESYFHFLLPMQFFITLTMSMHIIYCFLLLPFIFLVQVIIMQLCNQILQFNSVLIDMDITNLFLAKGLCQLSFLKSLKSSLFFRALSIFTFFTLSDNLSKFVLNSILLLDHLSLKRNIESPLVLSLLVVNLFLSSL